MILKIFFILIKNEKVPVHGNGEYVRNWIHVEDNVDALYTIVNSGEENSYYHISADEEYSVKEIVEMIAEIFGKDYKGIADFSSDRSGCDLRYALDGGLMRSIGWEPKLKFSERIQQVSDWYLSRNKWLEV